MRTRVFFVCSSSSLAIKSLILYLLFGVHVVSL